MKKIIILSSKKNIMKVKIFENLLNILKKFSKHWEVFFNAEIHLEIIKQHKKNSIHISFKNYWIRKIIAQKSNEIWLFFLQNTQLFFKNFCIFLNQFSVTFTKKLSVMMQLLFFNFSNLKSFKQMLFFIEKSDLFLLNFFTSLKKSENIHCKKIRKQ